MYKNPMYQLTAETIVWATSSNPPPAALRTDRPQALERISWLGRLLADGVRSPAKLKLSALVLLAGFCLFAPGPACAEPISNANATILGPNVYVFDTNMANSDIQGVCSNVYNQMQAAQFASQGYALLFKPGTYNVDCNVGFYTQVAGLGQNPDNVLINGGVNVNAQWNNGEALDNFWRSVENFAVVPTATDTNTDTSPGITRIAVSQAAPIRRLHVEGELDLYDNWASCHCGAGYASGGFLADSEVDGKVAPASQQQWLSRNSTWANWGGAVWNMVFVGCQNAPTNSFPSPAYTVVAATPVIREKPYLYVDGSGNFAVFVPALETYSSGVSWANGSTPGTSVPISQFYIAQSSTDTAATLNAALAAGKNILFTPGTYALNGTLTVNNANTILMGLGVPSLKATTGQSVISVADVDGVTIASLIIDAGPVNSPILLQVGPPGSSANHSANPTILYDLTVRTGGPAAAQDTVGVQINSANVVMDDNWIWRADHGTGVGWTTNPSQNGLVVNGNNVTCYGLFNEHHEQYQTLWNGNAGQLYMYQSECPYDVPSQASWMDGSVDGYASYKVASTVTSHNAWGVGIYCNFVDAAITLNSAIEAPDTSGVNFYDLTTIWLSGVSGSEIAHIVNNLGGSVISGQTRQTLNQFVGSGAVSNQPAAPTILIVTTNYGQVSLTWSAVTNATSYNVKRATSSGAETTIAATASTNYTDTSVVNGTTYYYMVSAITNGLESPNSAEVTATPPTPPPGAPTITTFPYYGRVTLAWPAVATATTYNIYRATTSGAETFIATTASLTYTDTNVVNGREYYYEVTSVNSNGESARSVEAAATPPITAPPASALVDFDSGNTNDLTPSPDTNGLYWNSFVVYQTGGGSVLLSNSIVSGKAPIALVDTRNGTPGWTLAVTNLSGWNGQAAGSSSDFSGPYPAAVTGLYPGVVANFPNTAVRDGMRISASGTGNPRGVSVTLAGLNTNFTYNLLTYGGLHASGYGWQTNTLTVGTLMGVNPGPATVIFNCSNNIATVVEWTNVMPSAAGKIVFTAIALFATNSVSTNVQSGALNLLEVAQNPPAPLGGIARGAMSGKSLTLNWTSNANVHLQSATNLAPPVVWTDVPNTTGQGSATITTTNTRMFFRLIQP
jgi:hypothetical protein